MKKAISIVALAFVAASFVWGQWHQSKAVAANCTVVSVLLADRADRDQTVELFDSIRRENPALFDKLLKRAEEGDEKLARVQDDLACDVNVDPPTGAMVWPRRPIF